MSLKEDVIQNLREWADFVLPAPSNKILKAFDHDPQTSRVQKPFLTIQIPSHANTIGYDEVTHEEKDNEAVCRVFGHRWDLAQVDGYGPGGTEWVQDLRRSTSRPDVRSWLRQNGPMGIDREGPIEDQTGALAGSEERRNTADFRVKYRFRTEWIQTKSGIAEKLQLRGKSRLKSSETQELSDALDMTMTLG